MDTGVTKTFIKTHEGVPQPENGAEIALSLFGTDGQIGYKYVLGGSSLQQPTTDKGSAVGTGVQDADRFNLLNTGVHFLSGFDYLYDAATGDVGVRSNDAAANDDFSLTPLVAVSGDYPMAEGFAMSVPLYVAGSSTLLASGTATLSGGLEGSGTLTLGSGTLALSGPSVAASLVLEAGTVLRASAAGLALPRLDANGAATAEIPVGTTVQATAGVTAGDLIEVNGSDARTVPVTARYDAPSGTMAITAETQTAIVHLATAPAADMRVTVTTDGSGGMKVQMAPAPGTGASDTLGATAQDVVNGDLPAGFTASSILSEASGTKSDEGREMAQPVHTVAPGAAILFADGSTPNADGTQAGSEHGLANAINLLVQNGAKVIVDDEEVFSEGFGQAGGPVSRPSPRRPRRTSSF